MHKSQGTQEVISKLLMEMVSLGETELIIIYNIQMNVIKNLSSRPYLILGIIWFGLNKYPIIPQPS